jgi:hypothetical protein
MKTSVKSLVVAGIAAAGLAGGMVAVNAQAPDGPPAARSDRQDPDRGPERWHGPRAGMMGGPLGMFAMLCQPHGDARIAGVIAYGEKRLEITPDQMATWGKLSTALSAAGTRVAESCEKAKAEGRPENSTERLAFLETRMSEGLAIVQDVRPAYDAFYATLSEAQQKTLEDMLTHRMARRGGDRDHDRGPGRHHDRDRG